MNTVSRVASSLVALSAVLVLTGSVPHANPKAALVRECDHKQPGWLFCDDFETDRLDEYFEYTNAKGQFERVEGVGRDSSWGMRARYVPGTADAGSLKVAFGRTPSPYIRPVDSGRAAYREIYWRMYIRNQPGWKGGGGDKLSRATSLVSPRWAEAAIAHVWSGGPGNNENKLVIDPASGTNEDGFMMATVYNDFPRLRWLGAVASAEPLFDMKHVGRWYCVEAHARFNDPGQSNGVFELWVNDTLQARNAAINWVGRFNAFGFNAVFFENYWNAGPPVAEERYLDNIVVSTRRIGCRALAN